MHANLKVPYCFLDSKSYLSLVSSLRIPTFRAFFQPQVPYKKEKKTCSVETYLIRIHSNTFRDK